MRIGIAQIDTHPGAFDETVERMVAQSQRAAEQDVELLVFPLAALAGLDLVPYADRVSYLWDLTEAVAELGERLVCPSLVPVPMDTGDDAPSFEVLLMSKEGVRPLRTAALAFDASEEAGQEVLAPMPEVPVFEVAGTTAALAVSREELGALVDYDYGADVVIHIPGHPFAADDPSSMLGANLADGRFVADAQAMGAWMVVAGSLGCYGQEVHTGGSFVLGPAGTLVASAPSFEEALLVADVGGSQEKGPLGGPTPDVYNQPFNLWETIALGVRDYVAKQGYQDVALCVDGSLSSQVLVALASDALGPLHVHALVGASCGTRAPACRELVRRLGVDQVDALGQLRGFDQRDVDELQLAQLAREHGALVLSPLDKTGLALGLSDARLSAAGLCPLGDVYRTDVIDLAHVRNSISPLFRRVRLDEHDALSLSLDDGTVRSISSESELMKVDQILLGHLEYDRSQAELVQHDGAERELVAAVLRTLRATEPLRRAMPPALLLSVHALDEDRFPLGVRWNDTRFETFESAFGAPWPWGEPDRDDVATSPGSDASREEDGRPAAPTRDGGEPRRTSVEDTLAMLRDLAEQGGFDPAALEMLRRVGGQLEHEDAERAASGEGQGEIPWSSLFSEN